MHDGVGRRDDDAVDQVVGDVQQSADERRVPGGGFDAVEQDVGTLGAGGTIGEFFTVCVVISPSTSVR
ncbi:hypothetical protein P9209_29325 [Prescottella defluvii]|nr:hypothetical protein P9209_29325 [Prescottella defluvii]